MTKISLQTPQNVCTYVTCVTCNNPLTLASTQVGYRDESCRTNEIKYWSEDSVSEDFDMYIRLASIGSLGRYVMYTGKDSGNTLEFVCHVGVYLSDQMLLADIAIGAAVAAIGKVSDAGVCIKLYMPSLTAAAIAFEKPCIGTARLLQADVALSVSKHNLRCRAYPCPVYVLMAY